MAAGANARESTELLICQYWPQSCVPWTSEIRKLFTINGISGDVNQTCTYLWFQSRPHKKNNKWPFLLYFFFLRKIDEWLVGFSVALFSSYFKDHDGCSCLSYIAPHSLFAMKGREATRLGFACLSGNDTVETVIEINKNFFYVL